MLLLVAEKLMARVTLIALGLVSLAGCATVWVHPTKNEQEFYADASECEARGGQAAGMYDPYGLVKARVQKQCMYGKGWHPKAPQE